MDPMTILRFIESDNISGLTDVINLWRSEVEGWSLSPEKFQRVQIFCADFLKMLKARSFSRLVTPELPFSLWAHRAPLSGVAIAWKDADGYHGWVSRGTKHYTVHPFYYSAQRIRILLKLAEDGEWLQEALPGDIRQGDRAFDKAMDMFDVFEHEYGVRNITVPPPRSGLMRSMGWIDQGVTYVMRLLESSLASPTADIIQGEPWRKSGLILPRQK